MKNKLIGIAVYKIEDWKRLLEISEDTHNLEKTWSEWNENIHKLEDKLTNEGIKFKEILIDLNELQNYCNRQKLRINSESRAQFVLEKIKKSKLL